MTEEKCLHLISILKLKNKSVIVQYNYSTNLVAVSINGIIHYKLTWEHLEIDIKRWLSLYEWSELERFVLDF